MVISSPHNQDTHGSAAGSLKEFTGMMVPTAEAKWTIAIKTEDQNS